MKFRLSNCVGIILIMILISISFACSDRTGNSATHRNATVRYPDTRRTDTVSDNYHGTIVADPYRWLEDDNAKETKAWIKAQNEVTFGYLAQIPYRQKLQDRLTKVWNFERYSPPFKEGGKYYFFKNDGLQNQNVLYVQDKPGTEAKVFLDPNLFSKDGTIALGVVRFNKTADKVAFTVMEGGSDWAMALIMDVSNGKMLPDTVRWIKFSEISWWKNGFFYCRYPEPKKGEELKGENLHHQVYYHLIGTDQSVDKLIYEDPAHPDYFFYCGTTEDEHYLVMNTSPLTNSNHLYFKDLTKKESKFVRVTDKFDKEFNLIDNEGNDLLVLTNHNAPNSRIIAINTDNPAMSNWKTIIPEGKDVIQSAAIAGGKLVVTFLHDAYNISRIYTIGGKLEREISLPTIGAMLEFKGKREDNEAFYSFTSFTYPMSVFKIDLDTGTSEVCQSPQLDFDPTTFETRQLWCSSKDGTRVPMFVTYKKGIHLNGKNPCMLYGYGGFNWSIRPYFNAGSLLLLENGGIYAVANIRGGGEFGENWYKSGTKSQKQHTFDDFIAAAEYLVKEKYTSSGHLAIEGASNGGLLIGACMTQRPDLFQVCFPRVGVMDMLRYQEFTIGRAWSDDYGLSEVPEEFEYLYKYSPLHNIKPTAYPATLVMTGDHDDRVVPAHSFKFAAALQYQQKDPRPILIRIETSGGHGAGKPTSKQIAETADMYAFFFYNIGKKGL